VIQEGGALYSFFFQAEDGIRDGHVTGVQTCALPISAVLAACRPTIRSSLLPPYCRRKSALHEGNPGEEPGPPHPSSPRSRPLHIPAAASVLKDKPSKGGRDATVELGGGDAAGGPGGHRHRRRGVPRRVRPRAGGERAGDPDRARGRPTGVLPLRAVPVPAVHHRDLLAD